MDKQLTITPVEDLINYSQGEVIELPSFREGAPFVARLRRPSMMMLIKSGKIPNSLIGAASKLFNGKGVDDNDDKSMTQAFEVFEALCDAAFVEPTYKQLKDAKIQFTDEQYMAVFNYTQRGVKALETFRFQPKNTVLAGSEPKVRSKTVKSAKPK